MTNTCCAAICSLVVALWKHQNKHFKENLIRNNFVKAYLTTEVNKYNHPILLASYESILLIFVKPILTNK